MEHDSLKSPRRHLLAATGAAALLAARPAAAAPRVMRLTPNPGIADHGAMIQSAIDELESAGGGLLQLGPGIFHCRSGAIMLDPTKTSLVGEKSTLDFTQPGIMPDNTGALIISPAPGSTQYGQATQRIEGILLRGPGANAPLAGILFTASEPAFSSRIALYNIDIGGFAQGLRFGDRAYLIQVYSSTIQSCGTCIAVPENLADAGENISFFGCTFGNSSLALDNTGGFEFNFFSCSFDFVGQWFAGAGLNNFVTCHFEKQKPVTPDPLFDVQGNGVLNFHGGMIMVSGVDFDPHPANASVFNLAGPAARATLNDVAVYNLRSAGGVLATGAGRLVIRGLLGGTNKQIDPIPMVAADLFGGMGSFPGGRILIDADLVSDAADTGRLAAHYGTLSAAEGVLSVSKTGGHGNPLSLRVFCPIAPGAVPSVLFSWRATGVVAAATVWVTLQAVQKIGQDSQGRTQVGAGAPIGPLVTLSFGSTADWADLVINALNMSWDPSDDGAVPAWTTHLCVDVNLIEMPAGAGIQIKALRAFGY